MRGISSGNEWCGQMTIKLSTLAPVSKSVVRGRTEHSLNKRTSWRLVHTGIGNVHLRGARAQMDRKQLTRQDLILCQQNKESAEKQGDFSFSFFRTMGKTIDVRANPQFLSSEERYWQNLQLNAQRKLAAETYKQIYSWLEYPNITNKQIHHCKTIF